MGHLIYAGSQSYPFDDRILAHLKVAISMKLRRHECFLLSWSKTTEQGSGRQSIWLSPNIPLIFEFSGSRPAELNMQWIAVMNELSHSAQGLTVVAEVEAQRYLAQQGKH